MDDREKRARAVLAAAWRDAGRGDLADTIAAGRDSEWSKSAVVIRAMIAFADGEREDVRHEAAIDVVSDEPGPALAEAAKVVEARAASKRRADLRVLEKFPGIFTDLELRPLTAAAETKRLTPALAAEREACARIAEDYPSPLDDLPMALAMRAVAVAIRARG